MHLKRLGFVGLALLQLLSASNLGWAADPFYRIIDGPRPDPKQIVIDRFIYGTDVLYTADAYSETSKPNPIKVKGVVFHSNLAEGRYFRGTRNPVIQNERVLRLIEENKWEEAKLLQRYVPDAIPRTESMADVLKALKISSRRHDKPAILSELETGLRERYPDGFFLKPVNGFDSDGTFPSEREDFGALYEQFRTEVVPKIRKLTRQGADEVEIHYAFKRTPGYRGRVLESILKHPESVIVQERLKPAMTSVAPNDQGVFKPLVEEYRVHVIEGKVLRGTTEHRWEDARNVTDEAMRKVEAFVQSAIDRLPESVRKMCFALDVMKTTDGSYKIIELNAGGESGYLYPEVDVWVTQLLAEHYRGAPTELQAEFNRFKAAATIEEKEAIFGKLLKRPELKQLVADVKPMTELYARAKDVLIREIRKAPSETVALRAMAAMKRFRLEPYLSSADIGFLAKVLGDSGGPMTSRELSRFLGLAEHEHLVGAKGEFKFLSGLNYDNALVEARILETVRERIRARGGSPKDPALVRSTPDRLIDEAVVTRRQAALEPEALRTIAKDIERAELSSGARLFFEGSKAELLSAILKVRK